MFGQATQPTPAPTGTPIQFQPRAPTAQEADQWRRARTFYESRLRPTTDRYLKVAELAGLMQSFFTANGVPILLVSKEDADDIYRRLDRFNLLGRLIERVDFGQYYYHLKDGDIWILAPDAMTREQVAEDIAPGLGGWIIPVIVGIVLVAGFYVYMGVTEEDTKQQQILLQREMLKADQAMSGQPADVQKAYKALRITDPFVIKAGKDSAKPKGFLNGLFKSLKIGGGIGLGIIALLLGVHFAGKASRYAERAKQD